MAPEITLMGGNLGDIFWDLPPWLVYTPGYDLGCTIYVANPTDGDKEYALIVRLSRNSTVVSEEAIPVFGHAWFKVEAEDFVRLYGALRFGESNADLAVSLVERETQEVADSVSSWLYSPAWPGLPSVPVADWTSLLGVMLPLMMMGLLGMVAVSAAKREKREEKKEVIGVREERKMLPPGRAE